MKKNIDFYKLKLFAYQLLILFSIISAVQLSKSIQIQQEEQTYLPQMLLRSSILQSAFYNPDYKYSFQAPSPYKIYADDYGSATTYLADTELFVRYQRADLAYKGLTIYYPPVFPDQVESFQRVAALMNATKHYIFINNTKEEFDATRGEFDALCQYSGTLNELWYAELKQRFSVAKDADGNPYQGLFEVPLDIDFLTAVFARFDALLAQDDGTFERLVQKYAQIP